MAKSVVVKFSEDPTQVPSVEFEGDWTGRDIQIAEACIEKGYRKYQKARLDEARSNSNVVEVG